MTTSRFFGHELLFKTILDAESTNNTLTASVASIVEAVWFEMHAEETATPVTEYLSPVTQQTLRLVRDPWPRLKSLAMPDGTTLTMRTMHCECVFGRLVIPGHSFPIILGVAQFEDEDDLDSNAPTEDSDGFVADGETSPCRFSVSICYQVPPSIVDDATTGMKTWMNPIAESGMEGEGSEDNLKNGVEAEDSEEGGGGAEKYFPGLGRGRPGFAGASGPLGARISIVGFLAGFKNE